VIHAGPDAVECVPVNAAPADYFIVIGAGGRLLVLDDHIQFSGNIGSLQIRREFFALSPAGGAEAKA
jgi:hypothetical protein